MSTVIGQQISVVTFVGTATWDGGIMASDLKVTVPSDEELFLAANELGSPSNRVALFDKFQEVRDRTREATLLEVSDKIRNLPQSLRRAAEEARK